MDIKEQNEHEEKKNIRQYFDNKTKGVFVEVGAHEPVSIYSQTWHLENLSDWEGILVEPNPVLAQKARELRPKSKVIEAACTSNEKVGEISLFIPIYEGNEITGHASLEINADDYNYQQHKSVNVKAKTLTEILENNNVTNIDLLSIDVEGTEYDVLSGIDFNKYRPQLILLEDKHVYLNKHFFLKKVGYRLAKRENGNCWYIPKGEKMPEFAFIEKLKLMKRMYLSIWFKKIALAFRHKSLKPLKSL